MTDLNPVDAMTTDYRAMCAELLADYDNRHYRSELSDRARALLAQPEPEVPTDEEIMELMDQQMRDGLANAARALAGFYRPNAKVAGLIRIILNRHAVDHARAALAKWGHRP
jgi:hypothetical protein